MESDSDESDGEPEEKVLLQQGIPRKRQRSEEDSFLGPGSKLAKDESGSVGNSGSEADQDRLEKQSEGDADDADDTDDADDVDLLLALT